MCLHILSHARTHTVHASNVEMIVRYLSQSCFSDFHTPLGDIHTHILKELSKCVKQGRDSVLAQQQPSLSLTSTADQDGAWQPFPSDECSCNKWYRQGGHGSVTIHFAISERFHRLWIYMRKLTDANVQTLPKGSCARLVPNPHYILMRIWQVDCICTARLCMENNQKWGGWVIIRNS